MIAMTLAGKVPTLKLADNSFSKSIQRLENASYQSQSGMESSCLAWVCEHNVGGMGTCYEITVTCTFSQIIASRSCLTTLSLQQIPRGDC